MSNGKLDEGGRLLMAMGTAFCEEAKKSKHNLSELIRMADNVSKTGATLKYHLQNKHMFSWIPENKCQIFVFTDEKGQSSIGSVGLIYDTSRISRLHVTVRECLSYGRVLDYFRLADGEGRIYTLQTLKEAIGDTPLPPIKEISINKQAQPIFLPKEGTIVVLTPVGLGSLQRMRVYIGKVVEKAMNAWALGSSIVYNANEWVPQIFIYTTISTMECLYWNPSVGLWSLSCIGNKQYYAIDP